VKQIRIDIPATDSAAYFYLSGGTPIWLEIAKIQNMNGSHPSFQMHPSSIVKLERSQTGNSDWVYGTNRSPGCPSTHQQV